MAKEPFSDSEIATLLLLDSQTYQSGCSRIDRSILEGKALKTNKRFLKSVIRNANDHNRQLERRPDRTSTPARVGEVEGENRHTHHRKTNSHSHSRSSRLPEHDSHGRSGLSRAQEKAPRGSRGDGYYSTTSRQTQHSRSQAHSCSRKNRRRSEEIHEGKVESHSDREGKRPRERDRGRHHPTSPKDPDGRNRKSRRSSQLDVPTRSSTNETRDNQRAPDQPLPSTSKMDKYFAPSYDPRLDINLDDITNPQTGLIEGGNYDDWELILMQMKAKRDAKVRQKEKKLEEKLVAAERKLRKREKKRKRNDEDGRESDSNNDEGDLDRESRRRKRGEKRASKSPRSVPLRSKPASNAERDERGDHKTAKKHRRKAPSSDSDSSSDSGSSSHGRPPHARHEKRGLMEFKGYSKPGNPREWDLGKASPT